MSAPTSADWVARVNRAIDLVMANPGAPLDLNAIAKAVHSSPYHFHRVFHALVGETPHAFQKRVRLERALRQMAHSPKRQLTDIARDCGFSDSSSFSKAFKERYGVSPRKFDLSTWKDERRSELGLARLPPGENPDGFEVRIQSLPARTLACLRVSQPFEPGRVTDAAEHLMAWADEHGLEGRWYGCGRTPSSFLWPNVGTMWAWRSPRRPGVMGRSFSKRCLR